MLLLRLSALINAGFGAQGGGTRRGAHLVGQGTQLLSLDGPGSRSFSGSPW